MRPVFLALFLLAFAGLPAAAQQPAPPGTDQEGLRFLYKKCSDPQVARLVGLTLPEATRRARALGLQRHRVLHHRTRVFRDETVPGRLTLVTNDQGQIVRAFCK